MTPSRRSRLLIRRRWLLSSEKRMTPVFGAGSLTMGSVKEEVDVDRIIVAK
jgi:hypothetical protein